MMKAVIMAGGQGTRFWPASRENRPKQFLNILGKRTMLQETMARLAPLMQVPDLFLVCRESYVANVLDQAPGLTARQVIVEPAARNTAACIGLAAYHLRRYFGEEEILAVLPADHAIAEPEQLRNLLEAASQLAQDDWLVTFGIRPTFPATGFGYLHVGESLGSFDEHEAFRVQQFLEKPDLATARELVSSKRHFWNSGMFVWRAGTIIEQIRLLMPDLFEVLEEIDRDPDNKPRNYQLFAGLEKTPIDYGVMERAPRVAVFPSRLVWHDVGSWQALAELLPKDADGIVSNVKYLAEESADCIIHASQGKVVGLIGVNDLVIVETPDALLICDPARTEDVRKLVARLKAEGLDEYL